MEPDEAKLRFVSFFAHGFREERKIYDSMDEWIACSDDFIAMRARAQKGVAGPPENEVLEEVVGAFGFKMEDVPKYPNIRERCQRIGPRWGYFYDAMYRGLSAWQHGDPSRATVASSLLLHIPEMRERSAFESLSMVLWSWDVVRELGMALAVIAKDEQSALLLAKMDARCQRAAVWAMGEAAEKFHGPSVIVRDEGTGRVKSARWR